ncbi:MAG: glycosyltransferase family 39 protein [Candidatus Diapherotrites archaeon]
MNKGSKLYLLIFSIILFLSFVARIYPLQEVHWWDETVYLQHAEIITGLRTNNFDEFNLRPPLLPVLFGLGFLVWHHPFMASFIVAALGILGVFYIYLLGKKLYGEKLGLIAALFLGLAPFIARNSRTLMTDVPSLALLTMAIYYFFSYSEKNKNPIGLLSGALFGLAILMRFSTLPLLVLLFLIYWISKKKNLFSFKESNFIITNWKSLFIGFIAVLLPYFIWSQISFGFFLTPILAAFSAISDINEPLFFYISGLPTAYPLVLLIGLLAALFFLFFQYRKSEIRWVSFSLLSWVFLALLFMSLSLHKEIRYLISMTSIPVILLSSYGFVLTYNAVRNKNLLLKLSLGLVFFLLLFFSFADSFSTLNEPFVNPEITTEEFKVSQFIKELDLPTDTVIYANHNWPVFAYYAGYSTVRLEPANEDFYNKFPANMGKSGILIVYRGFLNPAIDWLDTRQEFNKIREFDNVVIYRYMIKQG